MKRDDLDALLKEWLKPETFKDVAENGLQVEGRNEVSRVICGVTANLALIEKAIEKKADAIFVHHGLMWGGGMAPLVGWLGERVRRLMASGINLFAYHLPLDAHPELGNNAGLADALGLPAKRDPFGTYKGQQIGIAADLPQAVSVDEILNRVTREIGQVHHVFGPGDKSVFRVGICSGGAPDLLGEGIREGIDLYLTGEVVEPVKSIADESGVVFVAAGHHATERFGPRRMAEALNALDALEAEFVDVENPV
jgi:dinuclear metal center YbgI/SA1388 family protein